MGNRSSGLAGVPLRSDNGPDYDRFSDVEGTGGEVQVEFRFRTGKKPLWRFTLGAFFVFLAFVIVTGVSCGLELECKEGGAPTLNHIMKNTTTTGDFAMVSISSLVLVHFTEVYSVKQLVAVESKALGIVQLWIAIALYASIFANIVFKEWYVMMISAILTGLWMCIVCEALRRFYRTARSRKLWAFTVITCIGFLLVASIYVVFNSVPQIDFPMKNVAVLVAEILVLVFVALFTLLLIFHTKWVLIEAVVLK